MDFALVLSGLLLGLAGAPHCVAMCSAPCALATGGGRASSAWAFHGSRIAGYALAGAVVASSVGALASLSSLSPALRPLWTLVHAAALALGLWLAWQGRQPQWLEDLGRGARRQVDGPGGWMPMKGPARSAVVGAAWVAWPCGLLQSALVVAALANDAAGGALVMAAFGVATAGGLLLGPWAWRRLSGGSAVVSASLGIRLAGVMLALASSWSLGAGIWHKAMAYCFG